MRSYDIFELILILLWLTILGLQVYLFGYEDGKRAGRRLGGREDGGSCERKEDEQ
jgi:hypothetical protein